MHPLPKRLLPFFWHFIRPYTWLMATLLLTGLLWALQNSFSPYLLKVMIDRISAHTGNKADIITIIWLPAAGYVLVWLAMAINFRVVDWVRLIVFPNIRRDIIASMFSYLNRHSHDYLQNHFAGSLSNKITDMAGSTAALFSRIDEAVANILACMIALIAMSFIHPIFSEILLGWVIIFIAITLFFSKKTILLSHDFSESKSTLSGMIVDSVSNLTTMRLFARNHYENKRLQDAISDTVHKDRLVQRTILWMRIFWDVSFMSLISAMLGSLIVMYSRGKITVGDFAFIMTISLNVFMHVWHLASQCVQFAEDLGKCSQALSIITPPHAITDRSDAKPLLVTSGQIMFDDVSFHYQNNQQLFQNKQVTIEAGSHVGLVGFSGSGKTTFVNLILRFFDVESGRILIDGQDISTVTQDSLHEAISMIPQDTSLFHRTLMENIRYGKLTATDEEVIRASQQAHCHEFISQLPDGYASLVGERGIKLSGGQRQRIAIARAILKDAPILILDEATASLDSVTEHYIQEGLRSLMADRTTIVIAHRLSTLSAMDRILVFSHGQIIEDGTHDQLLAQGSHYASMWHMQAGGFLPETEAMESAQDSC